MISDSSLPLKDWSQVALHSVAVTYSSHFTLHFGHGVQHCGVQQCAVNFPPVKRRCPALSSWSCVLTAMPPPFLATKSSSPMFFCLLVCCLVYCLCLLVRLFCLLVQCGYCNATTPFSLFNNIIIVTIMSKSTRKHKLIISSRQSNVHTIIVG